LKGDSPDTLSLLAEVRSKMGVIIPDDEFGPGSEETLASRKYYRPSAEVPGGFEGPFGERETWWRDRVRFWLVGRDGRALKGKYVPEADAKERVQ
jgi:hypothetical protein